MGGNMLRLFFLILLGTQWAYAYGPTFRAKTDDFFVDNRCEQYLPSYFTSHEVTFFTVSTKGTKRAGFDEEIPLSRDEARLLWTAVNPNSKPQQALQSRRRIESQDMMSAHLKILEEGRVYRGAKYYSEGEILEILSYEYLPLSESFLQIIRNYFGHDDFRYQDFFITGGVSYYNKSGRTVGELDVVVGDAETCSVFAIGEAKLGGRRTKAERQLDRISDFIQGLK